MQDSGLTGLVVDSTGAKFEQWSGLMRQVVAAAPQEPAVQEALDTARASLRNGLNRAARRLAEMDALREGIDADQAADVLLFFLGNSAYFTLTDELNWPLPRSREWLLELVETILR
ncbi:hypothetical protein [Cryptosporangium sp. NPDC048952]|uniref:hypothetical protein n=1 Tax=Cryptosporangium sp. NPDC048952 TaxID=3363961 RepID=UPI003714299A